MWPNFASASAAESAAVDSQEIGNFEGTISNSGEVLRVDLLPTAPAEESLGPLSRLDAILRCLAETSSEACLSQLDFSEISPDEFAEILSSDQILFIDKAGLIVILMKSLGPREMGSFFDTVIQMMDGQPSDHYRIFEGAMGIMYSNDRTWAEWFFEGLTPRDIFFKDGTGLMIMMFNPVDDLPEELWKTLREGGLGEWGGEDGQVELAYSAYMRRLVYTSPESALDYANDALQSASVSGEALIDIAQNTVIYVSVLARKNPSINSQAIEEVLTSLLTHPRAEVAAAVQYVGMFSEQPFPGLSPEVSERYLREARAILERR